MLTSVGEVRSALQDQKFEAESKLRRMSWTDDEKALEIQRLEEDVKEAREAA